LSGPDYDHAHDALRPVGIFPTSISAQHTLKKADLLCDYIDCLLSCELIGNRGSGVNRFELFDCSGEISPRIRHCLDGSCSSQGRDNDLDHRDRGLSAQHNLIAIREDGSPDLCCWPWAGTSLALAFDDETEPSSLPEGP
jgi:hypothetical protein